MRNAMIVALVAIMTIPSARTAAADNAPTPPALPLPVNPPSTPSAKSAPTAAATTTAAASAHGTAPAVPSTPLDPASELKRIHDRDMAYRKHAQSDLKAWNDSRPQRAEAHRADIMRQYGAVTQKPEAQAELKVHADRMARLVRALDVAEQLHDTALLAKIKELTEREVVRDARVLDALKAKAGTP